MDTQSMCYNIFRLDLSVVSNIKVVDQICSIVEMAHIAGFLFSTALDISEKYIVLSFPVSES